MNWPLEQEAKAAGCTCQWWGRGHIAEFSPDCPIGPQHKEWPLEDRTHSAPNGGDSPHRASHLDPSSASVVQSSENPLSERDHPPNPQSVSGPSLVKNDSNTAYTTHFLQQGSVRKNSGSHPSSHPSSELVRTSTRFLRVSEGLL